MSDKRQAIHLQKNLRSASALPRWLLIGAIGAVAAGCGGGGSSSSGGGDPEQGLTEEEQAMAAAMMGSSIVGMAHNYAESSAEEPEEPGQGGSTLSMLASTSTPQITDTVLLSYRCDELDGFDGEGQVRFEDGLSGMMNSVEFPAQHFSGELADGTDSGARMRADCVVAEEGGDELMRTHGSFDLAQRSYTEGRAIYAAAGAHAGDGRDDAPDTQGYMESGMRYGSGTGEEFLTSLYRYEMWYCEACVDGDLNNFTGSEAFDVTSVSNIDMAISMEGLAMDVQLGEFGGTPFVFTSSEAGSGAAEVSLDGRMAYLDRNTGCGIDATYETVESLHISDYDTDDSSTDSGEIKVTLNESSATYTVTFNNGQPTLFNASGAVVTPEMSDAAARCGFDTGGDGAATGGTDDLAGVWVSGCMQMDQSTWGQLTLEITPTLYIETARLYDEGACMGSATETNGTNWSYIVGAEVSTEPGAYELDLYKLDGSRVFDIFKIEGDSLYLGAPDSGPDDEPSRPETVDRSWEFTLQ